MICSIINSGIYHIYTVSLVFLPFRNSGDEMCNTRSFDPSELHTSTHLPTQYPDSYQASYNCQQPFEGLFSPSFLTSSGQILPCQTLLYMR
jgi:hypothetical protein